MAEKGLPKFSTHDLDIIHGRAPLPDPRGLPRTVVKAIEHIAHHGTLDNHPHTVEEQRPIPIESVFSKPLGSVVTVYKARSHL